MARVLEIKVEVDGTQAKRELAAVDQQVAAVSGTTSTKLSTALDAVDRKWQTVTGTMKNARGVLNDVAEGAGITVAQLGLMNSALAVAGSAMAGWNAGRAIAQFFDLDKKIGDATAALLNFGDVAAETSGAKADTIRLAVERGANAMITYTEAIKFNTQWSKNQAEAWGVLNDIAARQNAPKEFAEQMKKWRDEIRLVQDAGALPALKAGLDSHVISVKELSASYRISEGAINVFKQDMAKAADASKKAAADHEAAAKKVVEANKAWLDSIHTLKINTEELVISGLPMVGLINDLGDAAAARMLDLRPLDSTLLNMGNVTIPKVTSSLKDLGGSGGVLDQAFESFRKFGEAFQPGNLFHNLMNAGLSGIFGQGGLLANLAMEGFRKLGEIAWEGLKKVGGFFKDIFGGPNADELAGRQIVQSFEGNLRKMLTESQKIEMGNEEWKGTVIAIRDSYMEMGRTEADALADTKRLWDSAKDGPDAVQRIIDEIVSKMHTQVPAAAQATAEALMNIPRDIRIDITTVHTEVYERQGDEFASMGGVVGPHGIQYLARGGRVLPFTPRGTDTVRAMLTPGEGVVNTRGMRRLGTEGLRRLNSGSDAGGGVAVTANVNVTAGLAGIDEHEFREAVGDAIIHGARRKGVRFSNR